MVPPPNQLGPDAEDIAIKQATPPVGGHALQHHGLLYTPNRGRHPHKEIREAIAEAEEAGLKVAEASGHTWGYVTCTCSQRIPVYSTGRNPEFGAKLIRKFTANHRSHEEPR